MTDVGDLILLPGMMCDARLFAPQIAVLQDSIRISVPLPVFQVSPSPQVAWTHALVQS